jgi:hypothetical protein
MLKFYSVFNTVFINYLGQNSENESAQCQDVERDHRGEALVIVGAGGHPKQTTCRGAGRKDVVFQHYHNFPYKIQSPPVGVQPSSNIVDIHNKIPI